jgi:type IX secretion system PorP/SprF family membrane protein
MFHVRIILSVIYLLVLLSPVQLNAQTDPHFTQYYIYPLYLNPALSGSGDGEDRVSGIFRNQWGSITNPYRTVGISYDRRTKKNIAFGFNLLNQSAGDAGFNYLNGYATAAYTGVKLGKDFRHRFVFAMQAGFINRRIDPAKFRTGVQWNPISGYNASLPTGEEGWLVRQSTVPDIGAGVLYYNAGSDQKTNLYAGASVFHLNRPKDAFVSRNEVELKQIPLRYAFHGGISYNLSNRQRIVPNIMYMRQGSASVLMAGAYFQFYVNDQTDFMFGAYYRVDDAVAPFVGVDWKNFLIGVSYDANASKLGSLNRNVNAIELSLSYTMKRSGKTLMDYIRCPRM